MPEANFIQIHSLHGYSAALLNRDDSGLAKRMSYGGTNADADLVAVLEAPLADGRRGACPRRDRRCHGRATIPRDSFPQDRRNPQERGPRPGNRRRGPAWSFR